MSKGLTPEGAFHSCPWILDQVLWDENSPCTGGATCGPSRLRVLITVKFSGDAETPQKALLRPLPPQCPQKLTASPFGGKRHCLQPATCALTEQSKTKALDLVLHFCILGRLCAPGVQTHLSSCASCSPCHHRRKNTIWEDDPIYIRHSVMLTQPIVWSFKRKYLINNPATKSFRFPFYTVSKSNFYTHTRTL